MEMHTKRILLISHDLNCTGAPSSLLRHAKYFLDSGHSVDVWAAGDGALRSRYEEAGLSPRIVENKCASIYRLVEENRGKYDLVICNTIVTYKFVDAWQRERIPIIWFIRETCLLDQWYSLKQDFAHVFKYFYNLYCPSEYTASVIRFYNKNVRIVGNSVEDKFSNFTPMIGVVRFGYIGSIIKNKGVDLLVDAFIRAKKLYPKITLKIAGETYTKLGQILVERTKTESGITWLGEVQNDAKKQFFESIDVLCVPSLDEPFGLTALEGAMYGKAVIMTDRVGAGFIADGNHMPVAKAGDRNTLEKVLCYFAEMDEQTMRTAQKRYRKNYLEFGCPDKEREAVLRMLADNVDNVPPICRIAMQKYTARKGFWTKVKLFLWRTMLNLVLLSKGRGVWSKTGKDYY